MRYFLYIRNLLFFLFLPVFGINNVYAAQEHIINNSPVNIKSVNDINSYPGGILEVTFAKTDVELPFVRFGLREPLMLDLGDHWKVIIGIDLETVPGEYLLTIKHSPKSNKNKLLRFTVKYKRYEIIESSPNYSNLEKPKQLTNLKFTNSAAPNFPFIYPIDQSAFWENNFGSTLIANFEKLEKKEARANSISFTSKLSHSVVAPQNAIVSKITTDEIRESTIYLDHGRGLYSVISGLTNLTVSEGDGVISGTIIARMPAPTSDQGIRSITWQTILNEVNINPVLLTTMNSRR